MKRCENPDCPDVTMFGVVGEYGDSLHRCPKCGEELSSVVSQGEQTDGSRDQDDDVPPMLGPLAYVATFRDWGPAHTARSALMASGFFADLLDENIVALHWTHSQAVFGFKLVVSGTTAAAASQILAEDRSADLAGIEEMRLPESPYDRCPRCGSENVIWPLPMTMVALIGLAKRRFFGLATAFMALSIGVYFPLFFAFQRWSSFRGTVILAIFFFTVPSLLGIVGLLACHHRFTGDRNPDPA